jgi:hypothetical protein
MEGNDTLLWVILGIAGAAYMISQGSVISNSSVPVGVTSYIPTANAQGNQFSCPTGTTYVDYGEQASGGGYCEVL